MFYHGGSGPQDMSLHAQYDRMDTSTLKRVLGNREFNLTNMQRGSVNSRTGEPWYSQQQIDEVKNEIDYINNLLKKR